MSRFRACTFVIAAALGAGACASTGATPRPFPTPGSSGAHPAAPGTVPTGRDAGYAIAGTALKLRGTPYKNGGADPSGFDCSGFVRYVFGQGGFTVPRTVSEQYRAGRPVDPQQLEPGDLVFFTTVAPGASHVGIAIGGDEFVHAPSSAGEVRVERLSASYWSTRFVGARRIL
jgi:cell wall-associated NlpC family hydrolase